MTIANIHHYFRLTPDHRLVFGGRARFAVSSPQSDAASGEILRAGIAEIFPQLRDVRLDYCWGGLVDMTQDRLPHAGERDGLFYSMGYSGHGTQMSVLMGERMAAVMAGDCERQPVARPRLARDSRPLRPAVVPAGGRAVLPPEGPLRLSAALHFVPLPNTTSTRRQAP